MAQTNQNATFWQGDARSFVVTVEDGSTAYSAKWALSQYPRSAAILEKTSTSTGSDVVVAATSSGAVTVTVEIHSSETLNLRGVYYHEAEMTDGSGRPDTIMTGWLRVRAAVIKST
jgi:hypothetical protein